MFSWLTAPSPWKFSIPLLEPATLLQLAMRGLVGFVHPSERTDVCGAPIRVEWDVCGEDDDKEPEEYTQTICCRGPGRKLEITYLVFPNAIETNVEVKLKLKDLGSRSRAVYGKIKASTAEC